MRIWPRIQRAVDGGLRVRLRGLMLLMAAFGQSGCRSSSEVALGDSAPADPPNILWIVAEDMAPLLGAYGTTLIETPNLDALAARGVLFSQVFMPAPVCSPSRSALITGRMATTLGTHNHHSSRTEATAIRLPDDVLTVPELFKRAGYATFNAGKDDYNFWYDRRDLYDHDGSIHGLYGKRGDAVEWTAWAERQPFFGQVQLRGGKEIFARSFDERVATPVDRERVELPPYLPEHPVIVEEYADHLDAIQLTDQRVGGLLDELRDAGLLEDTIVVFFSDHGPRITRHKQFLYDGGLHVPLLVADFRAQPAVGVGVRDDALVSGLDIGPTSLALAGIEVPAGMEGVDVFADGFDGHEFVVAARDRCDFTIDRIRAVRTTRFKYIRNGLTDRPASQATYMDVDGVPFVGVMRQLHADGLLDEHQARFFADERPAEELYDLQQDPFELRNLADDPAQEAKRAELAAMLDGWIAKTGDRGQQPEDADGLGVMLGIWGEHATNPEYDALRVAQPELEGSLLPLKNSGWQPLDG